MNCRRFRKLMAEWPPTDLDTTKPPAEAREHVRDCVSCAALVKRQHVLRASLRHMAAQQARRVAPARVEAALLREFRAPAQRLRQPAYPHPPALVPAGARLFAGILAGGAMAAVLAAFLLWNRPPATSGQESAAVSEIEDSAGLDGDFIPLPYFGNAEGVSGPAGDADVVRVEMPRSTLVALGVPVADEGNADAVEAELLLGAGGMPQAVRVLE